MEDKSIQQEDEWPAPWDPDREPVTLADWVNRSYHAADIFWQRGIDYWSRGHMSLEVVCMERNLDYDDLSRKLKFLEADLRPAFPDCINWPLDLLTDYVEKVHHPFLYKEFPRLKEEMQGLAEHAKEGEEDWQELMEIFGLFSGEVSMHMRKEEMLVFPRIRKLCSPKPEDQVWSLNALPPVPMLFYSLWQEHEHESDHLTRILDLIESLNAQARGNRQSRIDRLEEDLQCLSRDFRFHTHVENNLLFPGIMAKFFNLNKGKVLEEDQ